VSSFLRFGNFIGKASGFCLVPEVSAYFLNCQVCVCIASLFGSSATIFKTFSYKSQDKPSFLTSIVPALFRALYAHNMFRLLVKAERRFVL
jgi:hypothetical protein